MTPVGGRALARMGWAVTWAVGAAIGVALGAWLSVVGSAGAPGAEQLDVTSELVVAPLAVGAAVFVLYLLGGAVLAGIRGRKATPVASNEEAGSLAADARAAESLVAEDEGAGDPAV